MRPHQQGQARDGEYHRHRIRTQAKEFAQGFIHFNIVAVEQLWLR